MTACILRFYKCFLQPYNLATQSWYSTGEWPLKDNEMNVLFQRDAIYFNLTTFDVKT